MSVIFMPNVFALEKPYYENNLGVKMSESEYYLLLERFDKNFIANLSQSFFDSAIENINNIQLVEKKDVYLETITHTDRDGKVTNYEQKITEKEYDNYVKQQSFSNNCTDGVACWEINAKKLTLLIYQNTTTNEYQFRLINLWKTIPIVKSFDVIAFRWTSTADGIIQGISQGYQFYNNSHVYYSPDGTNTKSTSSGVGISMNIVDNTSTFLQNELYLYMSFTKRTAFNLFGTYQHATSGVSLANSQSYSFKSNGLGGVLYYSNSTIRNRYDGMDGISYSFAPAITSPGQIV